MTVQADPEDWLRHYAVPAGIHPAVAAFIRTRPDLLETTEDALRRGQIIAALGNYRRERYAWDRLFSV